MKSVMLFEVVPIFLADLTLFRLSFQKHLIDIPISLYRNLPFQAVQDESVINIWPWNVVVLLELDWAAGTTARFVLKLWALILINKA